MQALAPQLPVCTLPRHASEQGGFAARHLTQGIADQTTDIADIRRNGGAGNRVTQGGIAFAVDRQATHETVQPVAAVVEDLLLERGGIDCATGDVDLRPLNPGGGRSGGRANRVLDPEGFARIEAAVLVEEHQAVSQGVGVVAGRRLGHR